MVVAVCLLSVMVTSASLSVTQSYHTLPVERIATPNLWVRSFESRHLRRWAEMKALLRGLPLSWSKGPGCCSLCRCGATVLLFLAVSLRGRGSKLVTVSFRLQSRAFSSCLGGVGIPAGGKEEPPHPPSFPSHGLQTPEGSKEAGRSCHFPHIFSNTRAQCWSSHVTSTLTSQLLLKCFTFVSTSGFVSGIN